MKLNCKFCLGSGQVPDHSRAKDSRGNYVNPPMVICGYCNGTGLSNEEMSTSSDSSGGVKPREGSGGGGGGGSCFVATAVFETSDCEELRILRRFRDESLDRALIGRILTRIYYRIGPSIADYVKMRPRLKRATRFILSFLCRRLSP